jgi:hypothetical protein
MDITTLKTQTSALWAKMAKYDLQKRKEAAVTVHEFLANLPEDVRNSDDPAIRQELWALDRVATKTEHATAEDKYGNEWAKGTAYANDPIPSAVH